MQCEKFVYQNFLIVPSGTKALGRRVREVLKFTVKITKRILTDDTKLFMHVADELTRFLRAQITRFGRIAGSNMLLSLSSSFHVTCAVQFVNLRRFIRGNPYGCAKAM